MQAVDITGDGVTAYEVSFYYKKPSASGNARIWASWAAGGQTSGDNLQPTTYLPAATGWTQVAYSVVPNSGANTLNFEVRTYTGATVDWDSFYVGVSGGGGGAPSFVPGYENLDVGNVTTYAVTGLTEGVTYHYRAKAYNATSNSPYSGTTSVVTTASAGTPPVLGAIGNQSVFLGEWLQFAVSATPTESDLVTLTVTNPPVGSAFYKTNELGTFFWSSASPTGLYSVTFNAADKDGGDAETIGITVHPLPKVGTFVVSNGIPASATLPSVLGETYRMEFSLDLLAVPVVWTLADEEPGTGGNITLSDTNNVDLKRYYRIVIP